MCMNTDIAKLDTLIVTTIGSIRGYEHCARQAEAGRYADFFRSMAACRRNIVAGLQGASRDLGGIPADYGSTAARLDGRESLLRALARGDDALVDAVGRSEDRLKDAFEHALQDGQLYPDTRELIARCYESVLRGHHRAHALAHQFAFAA